MTDLLCWHCRTSTRLLEERGLKFISTVYARKYCWGTTFYDGTNQLSQMHGLNAEYTVFGSFSTLRTAQPSSPRTCNNSQ